MNSKVFFSSTSQTSQTMSFRGAVFEFLGGIRASKLFAFPEKPSGKGILVVLGIHAVLSLAITIAIESGHEVSLMTLWSISLGSLALLLLLMILLLKRKMSLRSLVILVVVLLHAVLSATMVGLIENQHAISRGVHAGMWGVSFALLLAAIVVLVVKKFGKVYQRLPGNTNRYR
jgi:hypothetical protein